MSANAKRSSIKQKKKEKLDIAVKAMKAQLAASSKT